MRSPENCLLGPCLLPGLPSECLISLQQVARPACPQAVLRAVLGSALRQPSPPRSQLADFPWAPEPHGPVVDPLAVVRWACPGNAHATLGACSTKVPKHTDSALLRKLNLRSRRAPRLLLEKAAALDVHAHIILRTKGLVPYAAQRPSSLGP